ncbi:MAG: ATP-dependent Clp protease ATP-binding subunit ClpC, partial [Clostridiales bacterium]|nr:ATP-dependent Clp protease ATP-binding subunit ClpC [Clostridiales bacterium]
MENGRFTEGAQKALQFAKEKAEKLGQNYVGTEHVLYGIVKADEGICKQVFTNHGVTEEAIGTMVEGLVTEGGSSFTQSFDYTPRTKRVLQVSVALARSLGHSYVGCEHLLLAILREGDSIAARMLHELGVSLQQLATDVISAVAPKGQGGG